MNNKCFKAVKTVGLRTNSKLCRHDTILGRPMMSCGLSCICFVYLDEYKNDKLAIEAVIKKHDEWMETDKCNRKREGDTGFGFVEAPRVRRSFRGPEWISTIRAAQVDTLASIRSIRET